MNKNKKIILISAVIGSLLLAIAALVIIVMALRKPDKIPNSVETENNIKNYVDISFENNRDYIDDDLSLDKHIIEDSDDYDKSQDDMNDEDAFPFISIYDATIDDLTETDIDIERFHSLERTYLVVASVPDKDLYLYGADDGLILKQGDLMKTFEWDYITPRGILPEMFTGDIDNDGVEEIICILYVGSGTGISITELHILEPDDTEMYRDIMFFPEVYMRQLNDMITFHYDKVYKKMIFNIGEDKYEFDAPLEFSERNFKEIWFGDIVRFIYDGEIIIETPPGYLFEGKAEAIYFNNIISKVNYENESFKITDLVIYPPENY